MNRLRSFLDILMLGVLLLVSSGCHDEVLGYYGDSGDGEAVISLEAAFTPFAEGNLTRSSNVAPARGFNTISDIVILSFSAQDGTLAHIFEPTGYQVTDDKRVNANASNGSSAELDTKSISDLSLKLPFGLYYIVAVANYGDYEGKDEVNIKRKKTSLEKLHERDDFLIGKFSLDDLRRLRVGWDTVNYANNRAMLGYFAPYDEASPHSKSKFPIVVVDRPGLRLRAWMRRCASKITVDFDGSSLSDNVSIYIKDVKVYDIAASCTLGFGNPVSDEEDRTDFNNHPSENNELIDNDGSYIEFGSGENYLLWPCISKGTPYIMEENGKTKKDLHTQDSECLYFYENMQGVKEKYDRSPVPNLDQGGVAEGYNKKDGVPYGTYIEVTTLHVSETNGGNNEKEIKYRFMLGKNVTDNFDAERNYHYKLTLKFLGNANEHHWHIDYTREEGFKVPNPWYVSYVYNHDAYLPFEFNLLEDWEIVDMKAKIVTNPWYPTTSSNFDEGNDLVLTNPDYEITPETPDGDTDAPYQNPDNKFSGNGFLSLRAPSEESVLTDTRVGIPWPEYGHWLAKKINQQYFDGELAGTDSEGKVLTPVNHGERVIIKDAEVAEDFTDREALSVKRRNGVYSINIPLFTREKALVKQTGYTGNNPFVGYQRVAKVELKASTRKKDDHTQTKDYTAKVNVVQVRRVVNPKGVYRRSGNNESFHVNLKFLTSERSDGEFRSIISRGPWMAEVLGDNNFITLDGKQRISGSSGKPIDFYINFNRMGGNGNKNAIVRIKYHNYTCTHLIFVRQGYDAQAICGGGPVYNDDDAPATEWNTCNMVAGNVIATDPRDEGSMFKFGNEWNSISSIDNIYTDQSGKPIFYEQSSNGFIPHKTMTILSYDGSINLEATGWNSVGTFTKGFAGAKLNNGEPMEISRTATMRDFEQLYLTKYIEFGYGVLYADGATDTQSSLEMVNGWFRDDTSSDKDKKGMRGVFAYYWNPSEPNNEYNAKNIFFPIGRSGYGHRKESKESSENEGKGILRYCANRYGIADVFFTDAPLFSFLYRRMGAVYWSRSITDEQAYLGWNGIPDPDIARVCGLDLNYFTFDVNAISDVSLNIKYTNNKWVGDACFVRTVKSSAGY